jgi:hypothetical protein
VNVKIICCPSFAALEAIDCRTVSHRGSEVDAETASPMKHDGGDDLRVGGDEMVGRIGRDNGVGVASWPDFAGRVELCSGPRNFPWVSLGHQANEPGEGENE